MITLVDDDGHVSMVKVTTESNGENGGLTACRVDFCPIPSAEDKRLHRAHRLAKWITDYINDR